MNNLKKVVFGILAMLVMVTSVKAADYPVNENGAGNGNELRACLEASASFDRCVVKNDVTTTSTSDLEVNRDITIDLGGNTLTLKGPIVVAKGVKLTLTNGKVVNATSNVLKINGELETSNLTINASNDGVAIIMNASKSKATFSEDTVVNAVKGINVKVNATVSMAGTWTTKVGVVDQEQGEVVVNRGTYTATSTTKGVALTVAGGVMTINEGEISGGKNALVVTDGEVTVPESSYANFKSTTGEVVNYTPTQATAKLNLNGGQYTSAKDYAVKVDLTSALTAKVSITGGYYAAGEGRGHSVVGTKASKFVTGGSYNAEPYDNTIADNYGAVKYGDTWYVTKYYNINVRMTEHGTVTDPRGVAMNVTTALGLSPVTINDILKATPDEGYHVEYVVTKADGTKVELSNKVTTVDGKETGRIVSFEMPEEDVTLTVYFVKDGEDLDTDEPTTPVTPDKPATDNKPSNNPSKGENDGEGVEDNKQDETTNTAPSTFDGIASFVTLAISSVSAAGYSIKKYLRK